MAGQEMTGSEKNHSDRAAFQHGRQDHAADEATSGQTQVTAARPEGVAAAGQTIPVVKLGDFIGGDRQRRDTFVKTLGDALVDIGFFAVEGHGIDGELIKKSYALTQQFFMLSEHLKRNYEVAGLNGQRGYTSFGREHAKDHAFPDLKEFWHVGRELAVGQEQAGFPRNVWPDEVADFKETLLALYRQLDHCTLTLLKACALYLGEPESLFSDMAEGGNSILRVIHYPPRSPQDPPQSIRAAAHEDINLITLLCEATDGGLELLDRNGQWRPIHALQGQVIVDAGDMLQNVTNGYFKSTTHRVVNAADDRRRRFSMPFFCHPRAEVSLRPLASCIAKTGGELQYADITAGAYLEQRLREIGLTN